MTQDFNPPKVIGPDDYEFMLTYPTDGPCIEVRVSPRSDFGVPEVIAALRHVIDDLQSRREDQL